MTESYWHLIISNIHNWKGLEVILFHTTQVMVGYLTENAQYELKFIPVHMVIFMLNWPSDGSYKFQC